MKKLIAISVFALAYCGGAFAQVAGMGAISGTVRDASGAVVPDAQVVVSNESRGIKRTINTTEAGVFAAPSLVPAPGYSLMVTKQGFSNYEIKDLQVQVGQNIDLAVLLTVAGSATQVRSRRHRADRGLGEDRRLAGDRHKTDPGSADQRQARRLLRAAEPRRDDRTATSACSVSAAWPDTTRSSPTVTTPPTPSSTRTPAAPESRARSLRRRCRSSRWCPTTSPPSMAAPWAASSTP